MHPEEALARLGGVATRAEVLADVTEHALRRSLTDGSVVRVARGRYALPTTPRIGERLTLEETAQAGRRAAAQVGGTAVLLTAAARWGWAGKWHPPRPQVSVTSGRRVREAARRRIEVRYLAVPPPDREDGWVTSRVRTAVDCARLLPPDEALAVVDSALREGAVERDELLLAAAGGPRIGRSRAEAIIRMARAEAANPFESVLRWVLHDVPGINLQPQVRIEDLDGLIGVVDLADEELRLVVEADSFEWHGSKEALEKDCVRYDRLVADGWIVLRVTWDMVMHQPERVRELVVRAVARRDSRVLHHPRTRRSA